MRVGWRIVAVVTVLALFGAAAASAAPESSVRAHGLTAANRFGFNAGIQFTANVRIDSAGVVDGTLSARGSLPGRPSFQFVARAECGSVFPSFGAVVGGPIIAGATAEATYLVFTLRDSDPDVIDVAAGIPFPGHANPCVTEAIDIHVFSELVRGEIVITGA